MKKAIKEALFTMLGLFAGIIAGEAVMFRKKQKEKEQWKSMSDKHLKLMLLYDQWMITKQEGKSIVEYFHKNRIESIAIYGMSYLGERLLDELRDSDIKVRYAIDQNAGNIYADVDVFLPCDEMPLVDAVIVTPVYYFYEIQEMLLSKVDYKIISLEDLLSEI